MPSSYTPSLRLVLPVQGELSGSWGTTVNNGLTSLVDAAIAGTATVSMTDANYTLTAVNESSDEARQMFIRLTGTLSATRNVICPAVSKLYFVSNETTGGQSIVFKTSSGTGITVPNGKSIALYCNGTNVLNAFNLANADLVGNVTGNVTGNAGTVTNGVYTSGSYANPTWITSLDAAKLTGTVANARVSGDYTSFAHFVSGSNTVIGVTSSGSPSTPLRTTYNLAQIHSTSSAVTGALIIQAPTTSSQVMHQFEVEGLVWNNNIVKFIVQGYRTTGAWSDLRKVNLGTTDIQVRWGVNPSGNNCLILGDTSTVWNYPTFTVTRATFAWLGVNNDYIRGWTVAVATDLSLYTNVSADIASFPVANTITNGVYTIGNQTIGGTKTFSSAPAVPDASFGLAKLQTVSTGTVLGRSASGTGAVESLSTLPAVNGSAVTNLNASNLASGTVATARLASGTANNTTFLRGDQTWADFKTQINASGDAPIYACRAWVNFNGTGTVAIRFTGNVSSITDNGTGDYTVNFTTAMPDSLYSMVGTCNARTSHPTRGLSLASGATPSSSSVRVTTGSSGGSGVVGIIEDCEYVYIAFFR